MTPASPTRPAIAATDVSARAVALLAAPKVGNRNDTRCTIIPTWAASASANGNATDQKCQPRKASPAPKAASPGEADAVPWRPEAGKPNMASGSTSSSIPRAANGTANPTPRRWDSAKRAGATVKPAALAPLSARDMASPRWRSKYSASVVAIAVDVQPAQPNPIRAAAP